MTDIGKMLIFFGLFIIAAGCVLLFLETFSIPKLPGDIIYKSENVTFFFPITTSILVSIILTIFLRIFFR